jgi:hypothetical protein
METYELNKTLQEVNTKLTKIDEDIKIGFDAMNKNLVQLLNLFQKYDNSYSEEMMKEHPVEEG